MVHSKYVFCLLWVTMFEKMMFKVITILLTVFNLMFAGVCFSSTVINADHCPQNDRRLN